MSTSLPGVKCARPSAAPPGAGSTPAGRGRALGESQALSANGRPAATACSDQTTALAKSPLGARPLANAGTPIDHSAAPLDIAVIGDTPYGNAAIALFPTLVAAIDDDPRVREVVHVGDLKSGSEQCTDARIQLSADLFNSFTIPFVYAIGDNEWTDCHRASNGGFNPLDRLAQLAAGYPGKILLIVGDSHDYGVDVGVRGRRRITANRRCRTSRRSWSIGASSRRPRMPARRR